MLWTRAVPTSDPVAETSGPVQDTPAEIAVLLQGKLDEIDQKIAEMTELRATIALRLAQACPLGL